MLAKFYQAVLVRTGAKFRFVIVGTLGFLTDVAALISFSCGLILDSVAAQRREMKRLFFLRG